MPRVCEMLNNTNAPSQQAQANQLDEKVPQNKNGRKTTEICLRFSPKDNATYYTSYRSA